MGFNLLSHLQRVFPLVFFGHIQSYFPENNNEKQKYKIADYKLLLHDFQTITAKILLWYRIQEVILE